MISQRPLRMCSWWLTWEDLAWPKKSLEDKIRYRADRFLANHIDTAVIFGAHFRWDFMPLWMSLHDLMHFIAEELHQRNIALVDHHSAVLTHRYRNMEDRQRMSLCTPHHVPFGPDRETAASWTFNGQRLNDWRMIRTDDHKEVFLPNYTAEEFCINHPGFRDSYTRYVKRLFRETGIDGLMCDDAFFYPRFYACSCPYCLEKFGHPLPGHDDLDFWGNWKNPLFREWIRMRYRSVAEFNHCVKSVMPEGAFLSNCCSQSVCSGSNELGLDYTMFAEDSTHVEMEMCGSIPNVKTGLFPLLADHLYHGAIAEKFGRGNFSLGYAFTQNGADFVWALNKFLGSGTWFSCAKHALRIPEEEQKLLAEDFELPSFCYGVEKEYGEYFQGKHIPDVLILFSKETRDNYGGYMCDYADDYNSVCRILMEKGYDCGAVLDIPEPEEVSAQVLILASTAVLTVSQREKIRRWLASGKKILASGPVGYWDERVSEPVPLIGKMVFSHPEDRRIFPHDTWGIPKEPARCRNEYSWEEPFPGFYWNPCRMQDSPQWFMPSEVPRAEAPGWAWRKYRTSDGELLEHFFVLDYTVEIDERLEEMRFMPGMNKVIRKIIPADGVTDTLAVHRQGNTQVFQPLMNVPPRKLEKDFFRAERPCYYVIIRHS